MIHEAPLLDYIVGQIQNRLLAPENFQRLKDELRRQVAKRRTAGDDGNPKRMRARLAKLDEEIKAAVKELRRTPDDLYPLAVDEIRGLRAERDTLASAVDAHEARQRVRTGDADTDVAKAIAAVEALRVRLTDTNPAVAREAIGRGLRTDRAVVRPRSLQENDPIALQEGTRPVSRSCRLVAPDQSAALMSIRYVAVGRSVRSMSINRPRNLACENQYTEIVTRANNANSAMAT